MWTLTPDSLSQAKNELKGRRAAIEARYAKELKALDMDLQEIETLERVARSFSAKHFPGSDGALVESAEGAQPSPVVEPEATRDASVSAPLQPTTGGLEPEIKETQEAASEAASAALPNPVAQLEPSPEELPVSASPSPKGGLSRWRIRVPSDGEVA